jgi:hypothetical protein
VKKCQPRIISTRRANIKTTESLTRGRKGKYQKNNSDFIIAKGRKNAS